MGETRVAEAERERMIQVANANKLRDIGTREAQREQAVRLATLDKEQKTGEQTAGFERDADVKSAEQKMRVALADAEAKAIEGENQAQAKVASANAQLAVKRAEAYEIGEKRKREAEASVQEWQNRAMAKAALADAERREAEQRAELEAPAKAQKARVIVEAEAEAEKRRIEAEGQAAAIFARLNAEARGQYEILAKKGEGLKQIIEACGGAKEAFQLLMLEHLDNLAEASAKAISNIKFDKVIVWENGGANGKSSTASFLQNVAGSLPPMMNVLKDIGGVEFPESLIKLGTEGTAGKTEPANGSPEKVKSASDGPAPPRV